MGKKFVSLLFAVLMVLSLASCGSAEASPEDTAKEFCEAIKNQDGGAVIMTFEDADEERANNFDLESMFEEFDASALYDITHELMAETTYEIGDAEIDGDTATVKVEITYKDCTDALTKAFYAASAKKWADDYVNDNVNETDEEVTIYQYIADAFPDYEDELKDDTVTYDLEMVKTDDGWKISRDLYQDIASDMTDLLACNLFSAASAL